MTQISSIFSELSPIAKNFHQTASSLVIIDGSVDDLEVLKAGFEPGAEVVVLHPQLNGIEQISTLVSRRTNLQKVHLISHGSPGSLSLGTSSLSLNNIEDYAAEIQTWFAESVHKVSLYIYGCQVAAGKIGNDFIHRLAELTNADIAAATQIVGNSDRGGVWQLDYTVGAIDAEIAIREETIQAYAGIFEEEELVSEETELETVTSESDTTNTTVPVTEDVEPAVEPVADTTVEPVITEPTTVDAVENADTSVEPTTVPTAEDVDPAVEPIADTTVEPDTSVEPTTVPTAEDVDPAIEPTASTTVEPGVIEPTTTDVVEDADISVEPATVPVVEEIDPAIEPTVATTTVEPAQPIAVEPTIVPETAPVTSSNIPAAPLATADSSFIDLSDVAANEFVSSTFTVTREAGFDNTVDFYEINADGSVVDPDSGATIAVGEAGYAEAALANRLGLELATDNGASEFSAELEGGKIYAPVIAIDSDFTALEDNIPTNDPAIYFAYSDANADGFQHVRTSQPNVFEFEDLPNGGDSDFDDIVVSVSLDEPFTTSTPIVNTDTAVVPIGGTPVASPTVAEADTPATEVEDVESDAVVPVGGTPVADSTVVEATTPVVEAEEEVVDAEDTPVVSTTEVEDVEASDAVVPVEGTPVAEPITEADIPAVETEIEELESDDAEVAEDTPAIDEPTVVESDTPIVETGAAVVPIGPESPAVSTTTEDDITGGVAGDLDPTFDSDVTGSTSTDTFDEVADNSPAITEINTDVTGSASDLDAADTSVTEDAISSDLIGNSNEPLPTNSSDVDLV